MTSYLNVLPKVLLHDIANRCKEEWQISLLGQKSHFYCHCFAFAFKSIEVVIGLDT
jgi:hypothetical protein